ncbi:hypothetical protein J132_03933 [Termitomyces sp. J132]|nr:hypothetical protein J132_03933 [Termitomyces sp. J132]
MDNWPNPPDKYNGEADAVKYYQFLSQFTAYLKKGRVSAEDQIPEVKSFSKGKAYQFYFNEVSMEMKEWNICGFFRGLFNACFPPNFWLLQQQKLDELRQGVMSVHEYAVELKIPYRMVEYTEMREKVWKLYLGLVPQL